ncbi:hypothetical protein DUNSADRAFT_1078 [Dunaliella salina]|uniref:Uncharacterized protein n=1 Tax=Dunaliella salina TaxID=3046 RepID=A0ABQ7FY09_DUNSA|nr:hypothetical protein DUNSADRAFT_1078 [Dunaliella salina]|eukprot:KAF5827241.1 hypothetical protein DUNSADRAFT_1078 [Dunaliella salina]
MGPKVGNVVSLETSSGEVVRRAQVFGYDEQHSMLILKEVSICRELAGSLTCPPIPRILYWPRLLEHITAMMRKA